MEKPERVLGRDAEWSTLAEFVAHPDPHLRLAVVSGRRRVGKSYLLRALAEAAGGLYVSAVAEEGPIAARQRFAAEIARYAGIGPDMIRDDTGWESLLETALDLVVRRAGPAGLLVIDEVPYWLEHTPQFPGLLQLLYDRSRAGADPAGGRVVLCGSAVSVMTTLLSGTKALRGRAAVDLRLAPFDLATTARHWAVADPLAALHLHATLGGSPGYRDLASVPPPRTVADFGTWVAGTVLNPGQALISRSETEYLLREDPKFTGSALHYAILNAVAAGASSPAKIGGLVGRDRAALTRPLDALASAGFLRYERDPLWERRPVITLADPIVRFHNLITVAQRDLVETGRSTQAWQAAQPTFASQILGPHFEHCARDWVRRAGDAIRDGAGTVAATVVNDRAGRARHEIDVIALDRAAGGSRAVVRLIGEAKATVTRRGPSDLHRLERLKDLLRDEGHDTTDAEFVVFSMAGFNSGLIALARQRPDVHLVDLPTMLGQTPPEQ